MTAVLSELLSAGLIEKIEGDDARFEKMEKAASTVAQELHAEPRRMIGAVLAGLDPDVSPTDPAIACAEQALIAEWKAMRSIHTSSPIGLLRAILLDACSQVAEGNNAAILWLTAADTLPFACLGREEPVVRRMLETFAERTELVALARPRTPAGPSTENLALSQIPQPVVAPAPRKIDRDQLLKRVGAAVAPKLPNGTASGGNPHWPHQSVPQWCHEFSTRMNAVLADELDLLAAATAQGQTELAKKFQASETELLKVFGGVLVEYQRKMQEALDASEARKGTEEIRLNALWWSEAMYSQSLRRGYRELPAPIAAVAMAVDLLEQMTKPAPASVIYLLSETVHRLPGADFAHQIALAELLKTLREARGQLPSGWLDRLSAPPNDGRWSVRDLMVSALMNREWNLEKDVVRAGVRGKIALSLPALARTLFRQEQAVQLAGGRP